MIVALRSETLVRRLETEKLKFLIAKLRREQFGQSSERGKLLVEQLELAIADVEESQGEAEAEADIAAPVAAFAAHEHRTRRPPRPVRPADLPVERIVYPAPCACAKCGGARLRNSPTGFSTMLSHVEPQAGFARRDRVAFARMRAATLEDRRARAREDDVPRLRQHH